MSKNHMFRPLAATLFTVAVIAAGACSDDTTTPKPDTGPNTDTITDTLADTAPIADKGLDVTVGDGPVEPAAYTAADGVRGGKLYDKWWAANGATAPTGNHALYPTASAKSGADTWRCKECHGWDYRGKDGAYASGSHQTGIKGVWGSTKTIQEMFNLIKTQHGFGAAGLADKDVWDLVKFLRTKLIDTTIYINDADKKSKGDAIKGKTGFTGCAASACHGTDGRRINFKAAPYAFEFVPELASGNPWEAFHKIRFGQPDNAMPASSATPADNNDVLAYAQSLAIAAFSGANLKRGGQLYDKWWAVNSATAPTGNHALYPTAGTKSGADTWRCKECHGWDYKGKDGAYATGSHATGIAGVAGSTKTPQEMFDLLKTGTHNLGGATMLSDADIWDLVLFVKVAPYDQTPYIDAAAKTFKGDKVAGKTKFDANCSSCHGTDGKTLNFGTTAAPEYIGDVASNPQEMMHKLLFGQPAVPMPDAASLQWSLTDAADVGAHAATLL